MQVLPSVQQKAREGSESVDSPAMLKRAIKLFTDRRLWVRQILVAGLSGGVAWFLGDLLVDGGGVVAAIVSTLSIRISLHKSIREGRVVTLAEMWA